MKEFIEKITSSAEVDATITLTLDQRVKSRLKAFLDNGEEVGLFMDRGSVLKHDDLIMTNDGFIAKVIAAQERLSSIYTEDVLLLARACYHLGNRHVELQITKSSVHYRHDHVLDDMIRSFGLNVISEDLPFSPESGAYSSRSTSSDAHHHHH